MPINVTCNHCDKTESVIPFGKDSNGEWFALSNDWPQTRWSNREDNWYCQQCRNKE